MKTLLVSLPWSDYQYPSIQIGLLAACARENGFDVDARHLHLEVAALFGVNDFNEIICSRSFIKEPFFSILLFPEKKENILRYLKKYINNPQSYLKRLSNAVHEVYEGIDWGRYSLVGFTLNFDQLFSSLLFASWLKRDFPNLKVVFGGPLVFGKLGISLLDCFPQVDWCVDGEGEIAFIKLLEYLSKSADGFESNVPGLIYRRENKVFINTRQQLKKLDSLPDPDFDHYFYLLDNHPNLRNKEFITFLPIECSRGCPHRCAFCNVRTYWDGYRVRPPLEVSMQIQRQSEHYRTTNYLFVDNNIPIKCISELFNSVKRQGRDYRIFLELRACPSKQQIEELKRAGVWMVQIGVEALSTDLLNKMNKGTRFIDNLQAMKFCEEVGIEHSSNLITNFPNESQRDIDDSVKNIEFASTYRPPETITKFQLRGCSTVDVNPWRYGLMKVDEATPDYRRLFPKSIAKKIILTEKQYALKRKSNGYRVFMKRYNRWRREYEEALLDNQKLLSYYDCQKFLRIEDYRSGLRAITLEGYARELYLLCDSICCFVEIKKCFPDWDEKEIKIILNRLVKLKVMYHEGNDYLSLAIRANGPK